MGEKGNFIFSVDLIEMAIQCIKHAVTEDSLSAENIDDKELKQEMLNQNEFDNFKMLTNF